MKQSRFSLFGSLWSRRRSDARPKIDSTDHLKGIYEGDLCVGCGNFKMVRSGNYLVCEVCTDVIEVK